MLSCAPGRSGSPSLPTAPPARATIKPLEPCFGSYRTGDCDTLVIARMGWYFDMRDSAYRTMYLTRSPNHFTIGKLFEDPLPVFADLVFNARALTITDSAHKRAARRIDYRQTDVTIAASGAQLAAAATEPGGCGPPTRIVIRHRAEACLRCF